MDTAFYAARSRPRVIVVRGGRADALEDENNRLKVLLADTLRENLALREQVSASREPARSHNGHAGEVSEANHLAG
jgi:hypothetical protein